METLEQESHLLGSVLDAMEDAFFLLAEDRRFVRANPRGIQLLKYAWEELQGKMFLDVIPLEEAPRVGAGLDEMEQKGEARLRTRIVNRLGEEVPVEVRGVFRNGNSFITVKDLSEYVRREVEWEKKQKEWMEKIKEKDQYALELQAMKNLYAEKLREIEKMREEAEILLNIDDLTGMYNHRFFIQQLTREVGRQKRYPSPLSLLMIDIDYFKHYNDTNGHLAGDQALQAAAVLIQRGVRETDFVARYGGEEFSAILINADRETAREIAERVRRVVAEARFPNEGAQPNGDLTVSIGFATFGSPILTLTDLLRYADDALYQAKKAGRNRVEG